MTRVEVVTTHVDGRRVRTVIRPATEAGTYHEHQENPTMPSPVKRSRRSLEDALVRAATRVETTEQAYHVAAAEVTRLRESAETMRRDVRTAEDGEQAAHDAAVASARLLNERSHSLTAMTGRAARLEQELEQSRRGYGALMDKLATTARQRDEADKRAARPLTADDYQRGEMAALAAFVGTELSIPINALVRAIVTEVLTPPPSRPEGAEGLAEVLRTFPGTLAGIRDISDHLASHGVRVTGAES